MEAVENIKCFKDYPLKGHTTLKVGGCGELTYFPETVGEMVRIIKFNKEQNRPITIIGAGSNVLISSDGIEGAVILTKNLCNCELTKNGLISVQAGLKSAGFSTFAHQHSFKGGEFLIGIPGFIGGAIFMNAGAHGQNVKDILYSVRILDIETFEIVERSAQELELDYRKSSVIAGRHVVLDAKFKMEKGESDKIKELMDFHVEYRAKNHPPLTQPSAGSTFRNPEGNYAAVLLQDIGARDWEIGGVRVSAKHTNFLYNFNDATSTDISKMVYKMYSEVKAHYGIEMLPEIKYLGRMSEEEKQIWNNFAKH